MGLINYNLLNIVVLFGAVQGIILCIYIFKRHFSNKPSVNMFLLFLFSLSFLNLMYAFLDLNVFRFYRPLHVFPFPYKWLIAPAFYLYVKFKFFVKEARFFKSINFLLFIPAIIYGLLRSYWFIISIAENSYRITSVVVQSNFFRIQEFFILSFNLILGLMCFRIVLIAQRNEGLIQTKKLDALKWLRRLVTVFILITAFQLITYTIDLIIHNGNESFLYLYPGLILNVLFIYWLGYIGFVKPKLLFNTFYNKNLNTINLNHIKFSEKLQEAISKYQVFKDPKLSLSYLALQLDTNPKQLSQYINDAYNMNFPEFINHYRIESVKQLLTSPDAEKYTLESLAKEAGFSSKSSFYAIFKKKVGVTPSEYKRDKEY